MSAAPDTPFLAVDPDVLERNLTAGATGAARRGLAWRPHAKTHKCVEIARRQRAHGAAGLSVATVGEAEVFADAGCTDLSFRVVPIGEDRDELLASMRRTREYLASFRGELT